MENKPLGLSCNLTSPQLGQRKQSVIASLKKKMIGRKELHNGNAYHFRATDKVLDELLTFIKTERLCCPFFDFKLLLSSDGLVWLELSGPKGAKEFINNEVEL